jgi:hypothetical protein
MVLIQLLTQLIRVTTLTFPFAHPPYSSRAFAYLAAAEYDALIATWHYKYQFNRPSPYNADGTITTTMPKMNYLVILPKVQ